MFQRTLRLIAAVVVASVGALTAPTVAYADTIRECYGNPGSSGLVCMKMTRADGYVTYVTATLTKRHADTCSVPVLTFEVVDPTNGKLITREHRGPEVCAASEFMWSDDHRTSLSVRPLICLTWTGFDPRVCVRPGD